MLKKIIPKNVWSLTSISYFLYDNNSFQDKIHILKNKQTSFEIQMDLLNYIYKSHTNLISS